MNLYWIIIGGPIYLIGVFFLILQERATKDKLIWTFWPPILVYPAFIVLMYITGTLGTAFAQKLDFRFPENFRGTAVVIPNMECGQEIIVEDGREVLNFPEHGVLLYQGKIEYGYINHVYRVYDSTGELQELPELLIQDFNSEPKPDTSELGVFFSYRPLMIKEAPERNHNLSYDVSTFEEIDQFHNFQYGKKLDNKIDSLILNCKN